LVRPASTWRRSPRRPPSQPYRRAAAPPARWHAKALLVNFAADGAAADAAARADALTREVQITFKRLDAELRALGQPPPAGLGGGGGDAGDDPGVRLQVQRHLAQALFKLSVEFRRAGLWGKGHCACGGQGWATRAWARARPPTAAERRCASPPRHQNPRKEQTRFLNKMEAQRGYEAGSSLALLEGERGSGGGADGGGGPADPGFTQAQALKVSETEVLVEERDTEIRKVGAGGGRRGGGDRGCGAGAAARAGRHRPAPAPPRRAAVRAPRPPGRRDHHRARPGDARPEHARGGAGHDAGPDRPQHHADSDQGGRQAAGCGGWKRRHSWGGCTRCCRRRARAAAHRRVHAAAERAAASPPPPPPRQVEEGTKELVKAEQTQKSGRAAMCITLLLVLVALFLILTIVRHA
jgi:hypothetical protein